MAQTKPVLVTESYLHIIKEEFPTSIPTNDAQISTRLVGNNSSFRIISSFTYGKRTRLSLTLKDEFINHFVMVKGLLEFSRSKDYQFSYNVAERSFLVDFDESLEDGLKELLTFVSARLSEEIRFKKALTQIREIEARHKEELAALYKAL
ncbi:hypothetical protein [Chryseosolibacter indicus]|uniref:Uncharacterized protein n=1 Tax=Chryseosolibacter indicus TaxID=2782351 RepID=A0ABS5VR34_9BACT|nr:hypothetical protein [Chryseosolibacter indicus]MBT1703920.1 hypothetical protein [Chryseosolibacter indicus]